VCAREQIPEDEPVLYTGDLFRRDEDGYFYFVSRTDRIIKSRGEKVSPHEVETALYALDGVIEAVVVGIPDPLWGEAIKAIMVLGPGVQLSEQQVRRHCARCLEDHMVPHVVEFRAELPKNERGKIVV
jgi:long-chain acyl-CoA synthetase